MQKIETSDRSYPGAAPAEEIRFFEYLRSLALLSETIKQIDFRFGEDSDDKPAVWITIRTSADVNPSKKKIEELNQASEKIRWAVLNSEFKRWPYIRIETD